MEADVVCSMRHAVELKLMKFLSARWGYADRRRQRKTSNRADDLIQGVGTGMLSVSVDDMLQGRYQWTGIDEQRGWAAHEQKSSDGRERQVVAVECVAECSATSKIARVSLQQDWNAAGRMRMEGEEWWVVAAMRWTRPTTRISEREWDGMGDDGGEAKSGGQRRAVAQHVSNGTSETHFGAST